jgi:hypothetical protein
VRSRLPFFATGGDDVIDAPRRTLKISKNPATALRSPLIPLLLALLASWPIQAGQAGSSGSAPEEGPTPAAGLEEAAPAEDPTRTAGGALALFMSHRHYLSIRQLKGVMTAELQARYDHDSVPFNGKKSTRIALFGFTEKDLKPAPAVNKAAKGAKPSGAGSPAGAAAAGLGASPPPDAPAAASLSGPSSYLASVQSLWAEQGEAVELRLESIKITRRDDGLWRVAAMNRVSAEPLRFKDAVPGVTALRLVLRSWAARDPGGARAGLSPGFLKRYQDRDAALKDLFAGASDPHHAAFQILDMQPEGTSGAVAHVRLFEAFTDRPSPLQGSNHTLRMVKKGAPWLLDSWD